MKVENFHIININIISNVQTIFYTSTFLPYMSIAVGLVLVGDHVHVLKKYFEPKQLVGVHS